jgi:hypothetical protein
MDMWHTSKVAGSLVGRWHQLSKSIEVIDSVGAIFILIIYCKAKRWGVLSSGHVVCSEVIAHVGRLEPVSSGVGG